MILKYLKFLTKASNQHGVHSPFVYSLITKCFYKKTKADLWNSFLKEKQQLDINSNNYSVKKAKLLIRLITYFNPNTILNISNANKITNSAIKIGNKNASIIDIKNELEKIHQSIQNQQFDFIYFENNQNKKSALDNFETCLPSIKNNSFWVFNNIYKTNELKEAWLEIKKHKKVTVTVDLFFWGIVFFRKEQAKEHFKIRV